MGSSASSRLATYPITVLRLRRAGRVDIQVDASGPSLYSVGYTAVQHRA